MTLQSPLINILPNSTGYEDVFSSIQTRTAADIMAIGDSLTIGDPGPPYMTQLATHLSGAQTIDEWAYGGYKAYNIRRVMVDTLGVVSWDFVDDYYPFEEANDARLSFVTVAGENALKITQGGDADPAAFNDGVLPGGAIYQLTGYATGDGTAHIEIYDGTTLRWTGTSSTARQVIDITKTAFTRELYIYVKGGSAGNYCTIDNLEINLDDKTDVAKEDVIVLAGANDLATGRGTAATTADLGYIYDSINRAGVRSIAILMTPWASHSSGAGLQVETLAVNDFIRDSSAMHVVDAYELGDSNRELLAPNDSGDGLHMTSAGYAALGTIVFNRGYKNALFENPNLQNAIRQNA